MLDRPDGPNRWYGDVHEDCAHATPSEGRNEEQKDTKDTTEMKEN